MNCRMAEGMVSRYINHSLSVEELEEFLEHIEECSSCHDELETYFIVHEAMQQLNESGSESVLDFTELLENDIRKSRHYIRRKKILNFLICLAVSALIIGLASLAVYILMNVFR